VADAEERSDASLSRRRFVVGGAGAALGTAAVSGSIAAAAGLSKAPAPTLTPARRRLYRALVEAVGSRPGTIVEPARAGDVATELATRYAQAALELRAGVDAVLDSVERGLVPGSFASMSVAGRTAHLRAQLTKRESGSGLNLSTPSLVAEAIALATAPFDPRGFTWTTSAADVWIRALTLYDPGGAG
jgi:hypothetical protein